MKPYAPTERSTRSGSSRARRWIAPAASVLLAGCTLAPSPPTIAGASPDWGYNGEPTTIEIEGAHFFPTVIVGDGGDGGRVTGAFEAWLVSGGEEVSLEAVQQLSYDRLRAEVPEGLATGVYDLRVEVPDGQVATAEGAFTVTDTRADHLDLSVTTAAYQVGEYAPVTIRLQDPENLGVAQAMVVRVRASSPTGAAAVSFYDEGLVDQQPDEEGVGVTGTLADDGTGIVLVTSEAADDVTIEVLPGLSDEATPVRGESLVLSWDPGPVAKVELGLPRQEGFKTRAGESFTLTVKLEDAFGNVLTSESADLYLADECSGGTWVAPVSVVGGQGEFEVELTDACQLNHIVAYAYATRWQSSSFEVLPAEQVGYAVRALPDPVKAGGPVFVLVDAIDAYGNVVLDPTGPVTLHDDLGGLDPDRERGEQSCPGFEVGSGSQVCQASLWAAGPDVVVRAEDAMGHSGEAPAIEVLPADPADLQLVVGPASVEAGEPFDVTVRVIDAYGNSVGFDPGGTDPVLFLDDSGTVACEWRGPDEGAQAFECTIEGAVTDANLEARVLGLSREAADPLAVTNAALSVVDLDPQGTGFVAGAAFTMELRGYDAFGNAYVVQTDPTVDLSDSGENMSPATAVLGLDGSAQVSTVVYGAGTAVRIYASQGGTRLGTSRLLIVYPDVLDSIAVTAPPWISVDEAGSVDLTAIDAYGNAVTTYAGSVTLSSAHGACDSVVVDDFVSGAASVDLACDTPTLAEVLVATDEDDITGESDVVDVVDLACANGPTASLTLDGDDATVRCIASGDTVDVEASTSGSAAGGAAIAARHYTDVETLTTRTTSSLSTFSYDSPGTRYVEALVVDTRACADLAGGYVYIGADDGEPTGPVSVSTSASTVTSTGTVTVNLAATDCTADIAAGQTLLVRADLGTPGATSTGKGLTVTLDGSGAASLTWTFDTGYTGTATFYAGSEGGGGIGTASVTVSDDRVLPTVVEVLPSGVELGSVPHVEIVFSEPMLPAFVTSTYIALTGPSGAVAGSFTQSSDLTTVTFVPTTALVGSAGTYTLSLSQNLRDRAGNQLDGGWSGVRAPATFTFGNVGESLPEISSCTAASAAFTPDTDDGSASEADAASVSPTATAAPTWWWMSVYDADDTRVRSIRKAGTATSVSWDGRGDDGIVQDVGPYRLSTAPIDTYGNVGGRCDVAVDLEQHVDLP